MKTLAFTSLLASFLMLILGLLIYAESRQLRAKRPWIVFVTFVAIWTFGFSMMGLAESPETAEFWAKTFNNVGEIFIPVALFHLTIAFFNLVGGWRERMVLFGYILGSILVVLNFTPFYTNVEYMPVMGMYYIAPRMGYSLYLLLFLLFVGLSFADMIKHYLASPTKAEKNRVMSFMLVVGVGFLGGSTTFLPQFHINIFPFGIYLVPVCMVLLGYVIFKYHLMDIEIAVKYGLTYSVLLSLILFPCYVLILWAQKPHFGSVNYSFSILAFLLLVVVAIAFYKFKSVAEETITRLVFKSEYHSYRVLTDFTQTVVSILDLHELIDKLIHALGKVMGIEKVSLFLLDRARKHYQLAASRGINEEAFRMIAIGTQDPFPTWLRQNVGIAIKEELQHREADLVAKAVIDQMDKLEAELCIPLLYKRQLIGFCNLGHKASQKTYSHADLELLANLATQAAIAIENARLYEEERKGAARLSAILATTAAINSQLASEAVLRVVIEKAVEVLGAEKGILFTMDEEFQLLKPVAWHNLSISPGELILKVGESASGQAVLLNRLVVIPDVEADPERRVRPELARREEVRALVSVPLTVKDKAIGAMVVHRSVPYHFSEEEIDTLTLFARQAAIALENARLFGKLKKAYEDLRRAQDALVEAERQEALTALAGAAAHELNQPLSTITIYAGLLLRGADREDPRCQTLQVIALEVERMAQIVKKIGRITRYETKPYIGTEKIVDLERSSEEPSS